MINYQYTYLLMGIAFLLVWVFLFYLRKDTRHQMLVISCVIAFCGPLADILYLKDWWAPKFIFSPILNVEAVIVSFMIGGIGTVIYEELFHKRVIIKNRTERKVKVSYIKVFLLFCLGFSIFFLSFALGLNSFHSTILGLTVPTFIIWWERKDLIAPSIITGVLLVSVAALVYTIIELITPGWINAFWYFKNVPRIIVFSLPIDDIAWYFASGIFIGPLYEYLNEAKLSRLSRK